MLRGILPDANCEGHFHVLLRVLHDEDHREFWHFLNLAVLTFDELNIAVNASDRTLWEATQQDQVVLITGNRNARSEDSLEMTIQSRNTHDSLRVLTLANAE